MVPFTVYHTLLQLRILKQDCAEPSYIHLVHPQRYKTTTCSGTFTLQVKL